MERTIEKFTSILPLPFISTSVFSVRVYVVGGRVKGWDGDICSLKWKFVSFLFFFFFFFFRKRFITL